MTDLNIVEKVIALEAVELFKGLTPDRLARIASIAVLERRAPGSVIAEADKPLDSLYVVFDGSVEITRNGEVVHTAGQNEVIGSWALFDETPLPVTAVTRGPAMLLRIGREDFQDLLSDHVEIMSAVFSALSRRFRQLVEQ